jgi:hypothetical protein
LYIQVPVCRRTGGQTLHALHNHITCDVRNIGASWLSPGFGIKGNEDNQTEGESEENQGNSFISFHFHNNFILFIPRWGFKTFNIS